MTESMNTFHIIVAPWVGDRRSRCYSSANCKGSRAWEVFIIDDEGMRWYGDGDTRATRSSCRKHLGRAVEDVAQCLVEYKLLPTTPVEYPQ